MQTKKLYYTMGEVSEMFDVNPSLIRYWEGQFDVLKPKKNKKGNRLFRPEDVDMLKLIYHLVKERGMTLEGAKRSLKRNKSAISRDSELLERLQRVKSLLMEVREDLKVGDDEVLVDESPAAPKRKAERQPLGAESLTNLSDASQQESALSPQRTRRPKARKERGSADKELFAFYEQSLFQGQQDDK